MKRFVITGGTGFLGQALARSLVARGDRVTILSRGEPKPGNPEVVRWNAYEPGPWQSAIDGADGIVHLSGERVAGVRYTEAVKQRLWDSRVKTTENVVSAIRVASKKPPVLVSASGIGYYGSPPDDRRLTEASPAGDDFLANLCIAWEGASEAARELGVRVVNPRLGIVFGRGGGALEVMAKPFKFFVGGPIAGGQQGVSWVHLADAVGILVRCLDDESVSGKVNVTSPNPASNAEVSRVIGKVLHRPSALPVPKLALKALFGEGAETIVSGQWALPAVMQRAGYVFEYPELEPALREALSG